MRQTPVSLGVMLPVIVVILLLQYGLIRVTFDHVEPRAISALEQRLAVRVEPDLFHVWTIRRHHRPTTGAGRFTAAAVVHLSQAGFMAVFIAISVANVALWVLLAIRFAPDR